MNNFELGNGWVVIAAWADHYNLEPVLPGMIAFLNDSDPDTLLDLNGIQLVHERGIDHFFRYLKAIQDEAANRAKAEAAARSKAQQAPASHAKPKVDELQPMASSQLPDLSKLSQ